MGNEKKKKIGIDKSEFSYSVAVFMPFCDFYKNLTGTSWVHDHHGDEAAAEIPEEHVDAPHAEPDEMGILNSLYLVNRYIFGQ